LVIASLLKSVGIEGEQVDEVIMGQVLTGGAGQNPARQAELAAEIPVRVPAMTVNKVCGAGQKSIHLAAQAIRCGDADVVVAGGQDSMTQAPHLLYGLRSGARMGNQTIKDSMIVDGLWDPFLNIHMGNTTENLARRYQVTRNEQDNFALASQKKTAAAQAAGRFEHEIVPVAVITKRGEVLVDRDEHPNPETTMEQLVRLKPVFEEGGTVTAGNSSGLNDGAAGVIVMSANRAAVLGLSPLARIASYASAGVEPIDMGLGPAAASRKALVLVGQYKMCGSAFVRVGWKLIVRIISKREEVMVLAKLGRRAASRFALPKTSMQ
jgi:acetyl-CoA C-acetyltransferase